MLSEVGQQFVERNSSTKKFKVITFCVIKFWKNIQSFQIL